MLLPHQVELRTDADGFPAVTVLVDLTATQARCAAHAVRVVRDVRYRTVEISADEVVEMRELTAIVDALDALAAGGATARLATTVARLGSMCGALDQFAAGEHLEREGDAEARAVAFALADGLAEAHADALHAALSEGGTAPTAL